MALRSAGRASRAQRAAGRGSRAAQRMGMQHTTSQAFATARGTQAEGQTEAGLCVAPPPPRAAG